VRAAPLGPRLIQALGATARGQLLFSLLLAIALVLAEVTGDGAGVGAAA
jgi:hypothetical protein